MQIRQFRDSTKTPSPYIFLDRDGVINEDYGYVHSPSNFHFRDGIKNTLKSLQSIGYRFVIITNQAGVARGYYSIEHVDILHDYMLNELAHDGINIDAIYFCPHHPDYGHKTLCSCRKPQPGMIYQAFKDLNVDARASWLIGDKTSDIHAGITAGLKSIILSDTQNIIEHDLLKCSTTQINQVFHFINSYDHH